MAVRDTFKPWRHRGASLGFVRRGVYWIGRSVHGRRYKVSTGCRTQEAALAEYARWERNPAAYVPRGSHGTDWDSAAVRFLAHSERVQLNSYRHVEKQESHLANLGEWRRGGSRVFSSLDGWTASDLRAFIADLTGGKVTGRKVGPASVNRHLASVKAFMAWARADRLTDNQADTEVPMVKEDRGQALPKELDQATWTALLAALPLRWRYAAEVQLGAGLRYGEVARLETGHIHPAAIHVAKAKGRKARTIPVPPQTVTAARKLLKAGGVPDDEGSQFNHRLEVASRRAGLALGTTTHAFRHTYACQTLRALLRGGQGLPELQARLGHASIRTTEIYLRAIRAQGGHTQVVWSPGEGDKKGTTKRA